MNVARSIFMRKGYLLTALAALVLVAASPGTTQAQNDITGVTSHGTNGVLVTVPSKVLEGDIATINVSVQGTVTTPTGKTPAAKTVTVAITVPKTQGPKTGGAFGADGASGVDDFRLSPSDGSVELEFPAAPGTYTRPGSIELITRFDSDAEDEYVTLLVTVTGLETTPDPFNKNTTITDADTQIYTISLPRGQDYEENTDFDVEIAADPAHIQASKTFRVRVADPDGGLLRDYGYDDPIVLGSTDGQPPDNAADSELENVKTVPIKVPSSDKNRVADTITVELLSGTAGDYGVVDSVNVTLDDIHILPDANAIEAVAKDAARGGREVTEIVEGGDPVYLTVTVDRGSQRSGITDEALTVDIKPADPAQVVDYDLSVSKVELDGVSSGKQSNDIGLEIELSALPDEDINLNGMEYLRLDLVVSGESKNGTSTSTGTFMIAIVDDTTAKVSPKSEAEAYPLIREALGKDPQTTVMNPGEAGTIMMADLFKVTEGYTASYKVSESGGAVSVTAPGDMVTITANAVATSKVTVTATAVMAGPSFLPEQTVSDVASITFEVMVEAAAEPVPALPLLGQLLLGLGLLGGGVRHLYRRRQG